MERESNLSNWGLLVLRLGIAGLLASNHGLAKFAGLIGFLFGGKEWGFVGFVGSIGFPLPAFFAVCAALAEFLGCVLLAAGLLTRYASAFLVVAVSVAVFFHLKSGGGFELAGVYLLTALSFVFSG